MSFDLFRSSCHNTTLPNHIYLQHAWESEKYAFQFTDGKLRHKIHKAPNAYLGAKILLNMLIALSQMRIAYKDLRYNCSLGSSQSQIMYGRAGRS